MIGVTHHKIVSVIRPAFQGGKACRNSDIKNQAQKVLNIIGDKPVLLCP
jgi:hypothetical protein